MKTLQEILDVLNQTAQGAEVLFPDGTPPDVAARAAELLIGIVRAAAQTHLQVTGAPLDLAQLRLLPHAE